MEMQQLFFNELMNCLKILQNNPINFPEFGMQSKEKIVEKTDPENIFELIINRKGHYNKEKMTYLMNSKKYKGLLVRLDVTGASHFNYEESKVETVIQNSNLKLIRWSNKDELLTLVD